MVILGLVVYSRTGPSLIDPFRIGHSRIGRSVGEHTLHMYMIKNQKFFSFLHCKLAWFGLVWVKLHKFVIELDQLPMLARHMYCTVF